MIPAGVVTQGLAIITIDEKEIKYFVVIMAQILDTAGDK